MKGIEDFPVERCVTCGGYFRAAYTIDGHLMWADAEPVEDGALVLMPGADVITALYGVDQAEGDDFWGVPPGAPRYREHVCIGAARRE